MSAAGICHESDNDNIVLGVATAPVVAAACKLQSKIPELGFFTLWLSWGSIT